MIDINLSGAFHALRPSIPHLKKNEDGGAIVMTNSVGGPRWTSPCGTA